MVLIACTQWEEGGENGVGSGLGGGDGLYEVVGSGREVVVVVLVEAEVVLILVIVEVGCERWRY